MAQNAFMNGMPLFKTPSQKMMLEHIKQVAEKAVAITAAAGGPCPIELQTNPDQRGEVFLKLSFGCILRRAFPFDEDVLIPTEVAEDAAKRIVISLADMLEGMAKLYKEIADGTSPKAN